LVRGGLIRYTLRTAVLRRLVHSRTAADVAPRPPHSVDRAAGVAHHRGRKRHSEGGAGGLDRSSDPLGVPIGDLESFDRGLELHPDQPRIGGLLSFYARRLQTRRSEGAMRRRTGNIHPGTRGPIGPARRVWWGREPLQSRRACSSDRAFVAASLPSCAAGSVPSAAFHGHSCAWARTHSVVGTGDAGCRNRPSTAFAGVRKVAGRRGFWIDSGLTPP
jgi:hypothetical protein